MPIGSNSDALAAAATARDDAHLAAAIEDLFVPDEARLDDRLRLAVGSLLKDVVASLEADLRRQGARLLAGDGDDAAAEALMDGPAAMPRLVGAGVLRDPDLMDELIAESRAALLAERLPVGDGGEGRSGLLVRLTEGRDGVVAAAAQALLAVRSRRSVSARVLPAELQHHLTWWVAAAIRSPDRPDAVTDRALAGAAARCLRSADEGERPAALAARLAVALDPTPAELPDLLVEALGDRQLGLFIALLARVAGVDGDLARTVVLDPGGERLWSVLRFLSVGRSHLARIGWSLAEADPRRSVERFAERLDAISAVEPGTAGASLGALLLPRDFRRAIRMVGAHGG